MEKEINIAAILKDKPKGTKLWSPIFGDCKLAYICEEELEYVPIRVTKKKFGTAYFEKDGKSHKDGDCLLFPAKYMLDWSKFAWKKGDVLLCGVDNCCIFKGWDNDEYTEFDAEFVTPNYSGAILKTKDWSKVTREDTIKQYIAEIEEVKGGKLNLETLQIEHPKQEFKDGDIVVIEPDQTHKKTIVILKEDVIGRGMKTYCHRYGDEFIAYGLSIKPSNDNIHIGTEEEKQQLFSALEKEGKRWNSDTKTIEDLPKKCEFEPFEKVLVRDLITEEWRPALFVRMRGEDNSEYIYKCLTLETAESCGFRFCIPYNEETKHLLGTTDEWKGGEA